MSQHVRTALLKAMVCLFAIAAMTGCTNVQKGAAIGGVLGAGAGAAIGSSEAGEGAVVGALGGGLLGALIGDQCHQREMENLNSQIAEKDKTIEEQKSQPKEVEGFTKGARGMEMTILSDALFRPGSAQLSAQGMKTLDKAAATIGENYAGKEIDIEGHTDAQPVKRSHWRSNWELGSARAQAVLHYLIDKHQVKASLLSATSYGEYRPVAPGNSKEDWAKNRRAVIVILSQPNDALANQAK
jgi:chemotaxis protein MotB